jgi:pSer/pThr/pTyr-binding forkhead associated (FHA) protein
MVQFNILSGKKAGALSAARRFPFRIGRAPGNDLQLDDDGIWDQHLTLEFNRQNGFTLATAPNALVTINGGPVQTAILRNGDIITLGSAKLQFWLAAARQRGLRLREAFVWALLAAVTAAQFSLIYWLIR